MEPSKEHIGVRVSRLNRLLLGKSGTFTKKYCLGREGLLDALTVLYDECNNDALKKDRNIAMFIEKYRSIISEVRSLRVNISDFEVKKVIGRGHFGEVQVVREKQSGHVYAMKTLRKSDALSEQSAAFYEEERDIMAHANSPWLTLLQYAFQDMHNLYLVMEFHPGGDLLALLDRFDGCLDENMARFYLAELVLAIHSLHGMGYVHRDVKPENILIDLCGHLKLADFGSAAKLTAAGLVTSQMPVGTPEYIAPEVLQSMEICIENKTENGFYGIECDYWSLGIVAYEMVLGHTPFSGDQLTITYNNIMNYKSSFNFTDDCTASQPYQDVVSGLLEDASSRLGHEQLVKHPFFASINWNTLREDVPPFIPVVNGEDDTSNFDEFKPETPVPSIEDFKTKRGFSGNNLPFVGFTYVNEIEVKPESKNQGDISSGNKKDLEDNLAKQKKEIEDLQKKLNNFKQDHERRNREMESKERKYDLQKKQLDTILADKDKLEQDFEKLKAERTNLVRTLEQAHKNHKEEEMKSLALIRESKAKWEKKHRKQITELEKQLESQTQRITELCTVNNTLINKLDIQDEELNAAQSEIKLLQTLVQENKNHMVKAREQSRRSVVGVESKLEQIAAVSQNQVATLKEQLAEEVKLRSVLQQQINELNNIVREKDSEHQSESAEIIHLKNELQQQREQCKELEQKVIFLRDKADTAVRNQELATKTLVAELEKKLRREKEECRELKSKLVSLEGELSESMLSQESAVSARDTEREAHVAMLEKELKQASSEKMKLIHRLQEAKHKEEEDNRKLETLEGLLERLEQGLARLEEENQKLKRESKQGVDVPDSGTLVKELEQQKIMLVAQVEKLETQVEKAREVSFQDRQAAKTAQEQLWKKEKELSDAKIDLRIAQREAKTAEEQVKVLQEEKQKWMEKFQTEKNNHASQLQAERDKLDQLHDQISALQNELQEIRQKEEAAKMQVDLEKVLLNEKSKELDSLKVTVQALNCDITSANKQVDQLERKVADLQKEVKHLNDSLHDVRSEKTLLENELDELKRKASNLEVNYNVLKDVCTMNDEQLEHYERVIESQKQMELAHSNEKKSLQSLLESLRADLKSACQATNEEKSLRMRAESQIRSLEGTVQSQSEELAILQSQLSDYRSAVDDRTQQVAELEDRCCSIESELRNTQRQLKASKEEIIGLKEENTQLLTQVNSVKETNFQLNQDLEDANDQIQQLRLRYSDLEESLAELEADFKQREFKTDATIKQQMKLIDHLRREVQEAGKKKKTFTNKLFGSRQKENNPLLANALSYRNREAFHPYKSTSRLKSFRETALKEANSSENGQKIPVTTATPLTPLPQKAITHLVQSPGTQTPTSFARQPTLQRMHYNIPHRFEQKLCMRTIKCAACLDSIQFGHYVSTCQECGITTHPKCALVMPSTCGLPTGFARHFSKSWKSSQVDRSSSITSSQSDESSQESPNIEGFVKIPKHGRSCWERKYMKLKGNELQIFDQKPTSESMSPTEKFMVCRPEGTTSIMSTVSYAEVGNTAKSDLPFIFKIEVNPRTTCWPGSSLIILALSFEEKQSWVSALESLVRNHNNTIVGQPIRYKGSTLLQLDRTNGLEFNCCLQLSPQILLLGAEEGLFSFRLQDKDAKPTKINGFTHIHQLAMLPMLNCLLVLAGSDPTLMQCDLSLVRARADTAATLHPSINGTPVLKSCLTFAAATTQDRQDHPRTIICAATEKQVLLLRWSMSHNVFQPVKILETDVSCNCIHFARHSIIIGCNKFYEIDLQDFSMDEFLDPSDKSLAHVVYASQQLDTYPVAILDVAKSRTAEPEYLLCFSLFGVFVDKYGQRTRSDDIKWSHLPLGFAYRKPYLFIMHFTSVEVMKLSESSFTRNEDDSSSTEIVGNHPEQTFIELHNPRYLGSAEGRGPAVYVSHCPQDNVELLLIEGNQACKEDISFSTDTTSEGDGADLNTDGGFEFSFTSSLANSLDNDTESIPSVDSESIDLNNHQRKVHFDQA